MYKRVLYFQIYKPSPIPAGYVFDGIPGAFHLAQGGPAKGPVLIDEPIEAGSVLTLGYQNVYFCDICGEACFHADGCEFEGIVNE